VSANESVPIRPPTVAPYIRPKPIRKYATMPNVMSAMFFIMMLAAFFDRVRPVSSIAKPACMKNTSAMASM
jgi:hypothetical protein